MGAMEDGWKRIIRNLQTEQKQSRGYISLKIINEDLGLVAQNVWISPTGAIQIEEAKNFAYINGTIVYTGDVDVYVRLDFYQSVTVDGGRTCSAEGTGGLNGIPCEDGSTPASSAFNGIIPIVNQCRKLMSTGDSVDAFIRQTSEIGSVNMTINKGVYHVQIVDTF